jgi:hypothetical protein
MRRKRCSSGRSLLTLRGLGGSHRVPGNPVPCSPVLPSLVPRSLVLPSLVPCSLVLPSLVPCSPAPHGPVSGSLVQLIRFSRCRGRIRLGRGPSIRRGGLRDGPAPRRRCPVVSRCARAPNPPSLLTGFRNVRPARRPPAEAQDGHCRTRPAPAIRACPLSHSRSPPLRCLAQHLVPIPVLRGPRHPARSRQPRPLAAPSPAARLPDQHRAAPRPARLPAPMHPVSSPATRPLPSLAREPSPPRSPAPRSPAPRCPELPAPRSLAPPCPELPARRSLAPRSPEPPPCRPATPTHLSFPPPRPPGPL